MEIICFGFPRTFFGTASGLLRLNVPLNRRSPEETTRKGRCSRRSNQKKLTIQKKTNMKQKADIFMVIKDRRDEL